MVDFTAPLAGEIVIFVAIRAQGYIMSVGNDVVKAEQVAAMATSIIVIGAAFANEVAIVIYGHYVFIRY